jgi:NO-binding membrane sensor protein with MHYT domain
MDHSVQMNTAYNPILVALSWVVAIVAAYAAVGIANRLKRTTGPERRIWQLGGAAAFGFGVWAMHFIGMTALKVPITVTYEPALTVLSVIFALIAGWVAIGVIGQENVKLPQILIGGTLLGAGIGAMHYTGMWAMRMPVEAGLSFDPILFAASVVVAVSISSLGLWIMTAKQFAKLKGRGLITASVVGSAIPLMHYAGMAAARFNASDLSMMTRMPVASDNVLLLNAVLIVSMLILSFPIFLNWLLD